MFSAQIPSTERELYEEELIEEKEVLEVQYSPIREK
jgi:hypothetical protein